MLPKGTLCHLEIFLCENCEGKTTHGMKEESLDSTSVQKRSICLFPQRVVEPSFFSTLLSLWYFILLVSHIYLTPYLLPFFVCLFKLLFYILHPIEYYQEEYCLLILENGRAGGSGSKKYAPRLLWCQMMTQLMTCGILCVLTSLLCKWLGRINLLRLVSVFPVQK